LDDGLVELAGFDLLEGAVLKFLENDGNFDLTEVNRIDSGNIFYDIGDAYNDSLIDLSVLGDMLIVLMESKTHNNYPDTVVLGYENEIYTSPEVKNLKRY